MALTPHGYPYPVGTDRVMDGDDVIHALATAVDTQLGVTASGVATIPVTAVNTVTTIAVTFPAGRFNAAPFVFTTPPVVQPSWYSTSVSAVTATGFTLYGFRNNGTAAFPCQWFAHLAS